MFLIQREGLFLKLLLNTIYGNIMLECSKGLNDLERLFVDEKNYIFNYNYYFYYYVNIL